MRTSNAPTRASDAGRRRVITFEKGARTERAVAGQREVEAIQKQTKALKKALKEKKKKAEAAGAAY